MYNLCTLGDSVIIQEFGVFNNFLKGFWSRQCAFPISQTIWTMENIQNSCAWVSLSSPKCHTRFCCRGSCPWSSAGRDPPSAAKSLQTRNYSHLIPNVPLDQKGTDYPSRLRTKASLPAGRLGLRGVNLTQRFQGRGDIRPDANSCFDSHPIETWERQGWQVSLRQSHSVTSFRRWGNWGPSDSPKATLPLGSWAGAVAAPKPMSFLSSLRWWCFLNRRGDRSSDNVTSLVCVYF